MLRVKQQFFIFSIVLASVIFAFQGCSSESSWDSALSVSQVDSSGSSKKSSTKLKVTWNKVAKSAGLTGLFSSNIEIDHYEVTAIDGVQKTKVFITTDATSTILEGLKAGTNYTITLEACEDRDCSNSIASDTEVNGTTSEEYWQLQGRTSSDSFDAMTLIIKDSNTKAYALRYGAEAPAALQGKIRLYYDGLTSKGVNIAITAAATTATAASAMSLTPLSASAYGLFPPSTASTYIADPLYTFQAVPLSAAIGGKIRMFMEVGGADKRVRIVSIDSQDGYTGEDFNSGSDNRCSSTADYAAGGGCEPKLAVGVVGDSATNTGLVHARQFKIGYPRLDSWLWDGAVGTFMVITGDPSCGTNSVLAYAVWNGTSWNVETADNCAKALAADAHGPVVAHLGGSQYKLYYEDSSKGQSDKPLKLIYADGSMSADSAIVDFADWEDSSSAREVHFLWPSGNELSASNESGLGDHDIFFPTGDVNTQFMYLNLGGFDDPSWKKPPFGIGMAVLINP